MTVNDAQLREELLDNKNARREFAFEIDGVRYGPEAVISHSVSRRLFEEFGFGNACAGKLTLRLLADNVPRAATVRRFVRLTDGDRASPWSAAGVFFVNRRSQDGGVWTVEAFDVIRKAEAVWQPEESTVFPLPMPEAADILAGLMGCELDSRTELNAGYALDFPPTGTTIRQELQYIAAAHGGNWTATGEGKLLLLPLGGEPPETHYLITERGRAILLGEARLLV